MVFVHKVSMKTLSISLAWRTHIFLSISLSATLVLANHVFCYRYRSYIFYFIQLYILSKLDRQCKTETKE